MIAENPVRLTVSTGILIEERLTHSVIGAFFEVYKTLGFGFLEHTYALAMELELRTRGHRVLRQLSVPVTYKEGQRLSTQRLDLIVTTNWWSRSSRPLSCLLPQSARSTTTCGQPSWRLVSFSILDRFRGFIGKSF
ncbi:MAG: GxxExxY protein [Gemmatimonadaceae bacterium]|nr:GxxExxY protein [Gemmatimonadaceae bacterium]